MPGHVGKAHAGSLCGKPFAQGFGVVDAEFLDRLKNDSMFLVLPRVNGQEVCDAFGGCGLAQAERPEDGALKIKDFVGRSARRHLDARRTIARSTL